LDPSSLFLGSLSFAVNCATRLLSAKRFSWSFRRHVNTAVKIRGEHTTTFHQPFNYGTRYSFELLTQIQSLNP
jgi:hypothetical protein